MWKKWWTEGNASMTCRPDQVNNLGIIEIMIMLVVKKGKQL
jgi:hypothetical protein